LKGANLTIVTISDMSMPVMDGMSATRAIRQYEQAYNIPRCCIIALTGLASASARLEAWNSGIDYFMTKPINFKELDSVLKKRPNRRMDRKKSNAEQVFNEQQEVAKEIQALEEEVAKTEPAVTDKTPTEEYKSPTEEHQPQGGHQGTLDDIQRQYEG
jgi:CheY-like chemotaxis protein